MARYTDADALLMKLPDDLPYKASVKRVLMQAPSADNAFVEEIARLQNVIYSYVVQYGTVKDQREAIDRIKAEVARDIFAEIEPCHAIGDFTGDKVYYAIRVEDYNKCKKKYTEEKA